MLSAHFDSWDGSLRRDRQRHRHDHDARGDAHPEEGLSEARSARSSSGTGAGEEQGLNGSRAFAEDHPEIVKGLQALFNQDNGTGRIVNFVGRRASRRRAATSRKWMAKLPAEISAQHHAQLPRRAGRRRHDNASFVCYGAPAFGLGATSWDYGTYTWHTNRDTFDKIVFDDLKNNATLTAMLVYLASEDPETLSRDRAYSTWVLTRAGSRARRRSAAAGRPAPSRSATTRSIVVRRRPVSDSHLRFSISPRSSRRPRAPHDARVRVLRGRRKRRGDGAREPLGVRASSRCVTACSSTSADGPRAPPCSARRSTFRSSSRRPRSNGSPATTERSPRRARRPRLARS